MNADAVERELRQFGQRIVDVEGPEFIAASLLRARDVAEASSAHQTGRLGHGWTVAQEYDPHSRESGAEFSRSALTHSSLHRPFFFFNNDFRASFFEFGTEKMSARPMLEPAILSIADEVAR